MDVFIAWKFTPKEIVGWCEDEAEWTTICPCYVIDSIVGGSIVYSLAKEFLKKMNKVWL